MGDRFVLAVILQRLMLNKAASTGSKESSATESSRPNTEARCPQVPHLRNTSGISDVMLERDVFSRLIPADFAKSVGDLCDTVVLGRSPCPGSPACCSCCLRLCPVLLRRTQRRLNPTSNKFSTLRFKPGTIMTLKHLCAATGTRRN